MKTETGTKRSSDGRGLVGMGGALLNRLPLGHLRSLVLSPQQTPATPAITIEELR